PETGSAAAVVAGHEIDAHADHVGDVEAFLDIADELVRAHGSGLEAQIGGAGSRRRRDAALGMAGGLHAELARSGAVEEPRGQTAIVDDRTRGAGNTFGIEGTRAQPARPQRIVDDANAGREQSLAELVAEKARLACDRAAVDGARE